MSETLDALSLPLHGSRLIEASAGTGKTWTIAALYVRLVVGHGCVPRTPREILVMTFTRAATRELTERIRRRLVQAAAWFRGEAEVEDDAFLAQLLSAFPDEAQRRNAAWRLAMAADAMDDAAIHTIDAWCQRMLREHAFDSGCRFDDELDANETEISAEAVRDYWRSEIYPLADETLDSVLDRWKDVDTLAKDVRPLQGKPLPAGAGQGSLADAVARARQLRSDALASLKAEWQPRADEMRAWLQTIWDDKSHPACKVVPGRANALRWIDKLDEWVRNPFIEQPDLTSTAKKRLAASDLRFRLQEIDTELTVPPCFDAFESLPDRLDSLPDDGPALRLHAAAGVAARIQAHKERVGSYGFADILARLDDALDDSTQGGRAARLRERIVAQYPVALIDEFQDTSPVQLRIFDRLYRIAENDASRALLLIGDPKQAIYRFRGADIYSYLRARRATEGRHYVLGTNHRSTEGLVRAVNALYLRAEQRSGEGAFMFRGAGEQLPFVPVQAAGRAQRLVCSGGAIPALTLVADEEVRNAESSRNTFAALCAERIAVLLNDPHAGFEQEGKPFGRLRPADIAVLVRTRTEAEAVRSEMRRRGLASVYLSDRDSVFQTPEAADCLRLLHAVAAPRDVRLARAALATALLGFTLPELVVLATDDRAFDREFERLQQLHRVWVGQGVLAMLRHALHDFDLPARWLGAESPPADGERRLTNVLHLAELLQAASEEVEGEQALVRWFEQQLAAADEASIAGDDLLLRLESDADLVTVVTVHKAKGLEYPLVFVPFAAHYREVEGPGVRREDLVLWLPAGGAAGDAQRMTDDGAATLVVAPTREQIAAEERERLREDLRLLYVALTRARHALWVGLSGIERGNSRRYVWHRCAIGYLLSGPQDAPPQRRLTDIEAFAADVPDVRVESIAAVDGLPHVSLTKLLPRDGTKALAAPASYDAQFERDWSVSSYSALVRDATWGQGGAGRVALRAVRDDEPDAADSEPPQPAPRPSQQPWHRFPRGTQAGNFLHDQLEWLAGERFALDTDSELQQRLSRRCERHGYGTRGDEVVAWLRRVCSTPLPVPGVALSALGAALPEMEFWFPSDGLDAQRVDELCGAHLLQGGARPRLPQRVLSGMLMGFVDLVFEHDGRYWVLDYKSNALGGCDADYTAEAMQAAMLEHRYDVQAALYLLALHRLLASRLGPAYAPARQLGGAVYLFLRGINGPANGCFAIEAPLALIDALDAMLPAASAATDRSHA